MVNSWSGAALGGRFCRDCDLPGSKRGRLPAKAWFCADGLVARCRLTSFHARPKPRQPLLGFDRGCALLGLW
jgi:hypothetical protein